MPEFQRSLHRFVMRGVNLAAPTDMLPEGDYLSLQNVRVLQQGHLTSRPGQIKVWPTATGNSVHSARLLKDNVASPTSALIVGIDGGLYTETSGNQPQLVDSGYTSTGPFSMVRSEPAGSPEAWMYVASAAKMGKVNTAGRVAGIGIVPPRSDPFVQISGASNFSSASFPNTVESGGWASGGVAGPPSTVQRVPGGITAAHVIQRAQFFISPSATGSWLQPGMEIMVDGEDGIVEQVYSPSAGATSTSIAILQYDSGLSGPCTLVLTSTITGVEAGSMILIGSEAVLVDSTSAGPDGLLSLRCQTTSTHNAGETVTSLVSFRIALFSSHSAGASITGSAVQATLTPTSSSTPSTGNINRTIAPDFSQANGRPIQPDDYLHVSILVDNPANMTVGRLLLGLSADNFGSDYYMKEFRASDFQPSVAGTTGSVVDAGKTAITNDLIAQSNPPQASPDNVYAGDVGPRTNVSTTTSDSSPSGVGQQLLAGANAWTEILFKVSELQRVGSNSSLDLKNLAQIGVEIVATGVVTVQVSGVWVGGTYGPDVTPGAPVGIVYRYRYRDSRTGARSQPGPASRYEAFPLRQQVSIDVVQSSDPQVDSIDIERLDPLLQGPAPSAALWTYVGTLPNTGSVTFLDNLVAQDIASNPALEVDVLQPFPTLQPPISGTCAVIGTRIQWLSGQTWSPNLVAGTVIIIGKTAYQVHGNPVTTKLLDLEKSAGAQLGATFTIQSPVYFGQPLQYIFGPLEVPGGGAFIFGLGDSNNPGTLYWTNGNDPDSCSATGSLEITPASEPLQSGAVWNSYVFVGSRDRLFMIQPTGNPTIPFSKIQISAESGPWSTWTMAPGIDGVYYLGRDGIYKASPYYGGQNVSGDLWPLFPHEGEAAATNGVNGYFPPNMLFPALPRISVADSRVWFDFADINGVQQTWVSERTTSGFLLQDEKVRGWSWYKYGWGATFHYWEEENVSQPRLLMGTNVGWLMYSGGTDDNALPITCSVQTKFENFGDPRAKKYISDQYLSADAMSTTAASAYTVTLLGDYGQTTILPATTITPLLAGRLSYVFDIAAGLGTLNKNISLIVSWSPLVGQASGAETHQSIYEWQSSFVPKPPDTQREATDWTDDGKPGAKLIRGVVIEANTSNTPRTVQVQYDGGAVAATLTVTHNGQTEIPYGFTPFVASELRLVPTDTNLPGPSSGPLWQIFKATWIRDPYPEFATLVPEDYSDDGKPGTKYIRGLVLEADTGSIIGDPQSSAQTVSTQVQIDGGVSVPFTLSCTHPGRVEIPYAFVPPFICHSLRLNPLGGMRIFNRRWIYDDYPELSLIYSPWENGGKDGPKYIRGVRITSDTANLPVSVQVQTDGGGVAATISNIQTNGQTEQVFAFSAPFVAYMMRMVPQQNWRYFKSNWIFDDYPDLAALITAWEDAGTPHMKYCRGLRIKVDTNNLPVNIPIEADGGGVIYTLPSVVGQGQQEVPFAIVPPFLAYLLRFAPAGAARIWGASWDYDEYPDLIPEYTAWDNDGSDANKFLQGMVLTADSANQPISLTIQGDAGVTIATVSATHNGQEAIAYSWDPPTLTHKMRIVPSGPIRIWPKIRWIWEPSPEDVDFWITQPMDHGMTGFGIVRDAVLFLSSTAPVTITLTADSVPVNYTLPSTGGVFARVYLVLQPQKGRMWSYSAISTAPFQLDKASHIRMKPWAGDRFELIHPFGERQAVSGARI